jgi:hypothetical protein
MRWFLVIAAPKYGNALYPDLPMPRRDQRLLLTAAVGTAVALVLAALAGHAELVAYAVPLLAVALPLLAGRYLGEETLERLRERRQPARRRVATGVLPAARRAAVPFPRGGRLIAHSLAERGPPAVLLT